MATFYSSFLVCHIPKKVSSKIQDIMYVCDGCPENPEDWKTDDSWEDNDGKFLRIAKVIQEVWNELSNDEKVDCRYYFLEPYYNTILGQILYEKLDRDTLRKEFPLGDESIRKYADIIKADSTYKFLKSLTK